MLCAKKDCGVSDELESFKRNSFESNPSYSCQSFKKILNCIKQLQENDRKRENTQRLDCVLKLVETVHYQMVQGANMVAAVKPSLCNTFCRKRCEASKQQSPADTIDSEAVVNFYTSFPSSTQKKSNLFSTLKLKSRLVSSSRNQNASSFLQSEKTDKLSSNKKLMSPRNKRHKKQSICHSTFSLPNDLGQRETWHTTGRKRVLSFTIFRIFCIFNLLFSNTTTANGVWWSPGTGSLAHSSDICQWPRQVGGKQAEMCRNEFPVMKQIQEGIELSVRACQYEMKDYRWNCSQISKDAYGRLMSKELRETGLVQALTAASITYQVTLACAKGDIPNCGCTNTRELRRKLLRAEALKHNVSVNEAKLNEAVEKFDWGGCSDNVEYGVIKSQEFLNFKRSKRTNRKNSIKDKIREHNQEAGRLAIKNHLREKCRCHGLTASCTMHTCFKFMPRFSEVADRLEKKYKNALRVRGAKGNDELIVTSRQRRWRRKGRSRSSTRSQRSSRRIRSSDSNQIRSHRYRDKSNSRARMKRDYGRSKIHSESLIFSDKSPPYCSSSESRGTLGTRGRECDPYKHGLGSCKYLCCGRGFRNETFEQTRSCNCRFNVCCFLDCDQCVEEKTEYYCL